MQRYKIPIIKKNIPGENYYQTNQDICLTTYNIKQQPQSYLFGCHEKQDGCNDGKNHAGQPGCQKGVHIPSYGKLRRKLHKKDISKAKGDACTDLHPDTPFQFSG